MEDHICMLLCSLAPSFWSMLSGLVLFISFHFCRAAPELGLQGSRRCFLPLCFYSSWPPFVHPATLRKCRTGSPDVRIVQNFCMYISASTPSSRLLCKSVLKKHCTPTQNIATNMTNIHFPDPPFSNSWVPIARLPLRLLLLTHFCSRTWISVTVWYILPYFHPLSLYRTSPCPTSPLAFLFLGGPGFDPAAFSDFMKFQEDLAQALEGWERLLVHEDKR